MMGKYQRPPYKRSLREAGIEENQNRFAENWLSKKRGEAGMD
jgi:hypothetical protein